MPTKFVIAVRGDIVEKMGIGKLAAQVGHAVQYAMQGKMWRISLTSLGWFPVRPEKAKKEWLLDELSTKIVVRAEDESHLLKLIERAKEVGVDTFPVYDAGLTVFEGERTLTCVGFGPDFTEAMDRVTKGLPLLK